MGKADGTQEVHDDEVARLTSSSKGTWLVTTKRTEHVFDLDQSLYMRRSRPGKTFPHDDRAMRLTFVERWPCVGETFFIWLDDPDVPELVEYWRQSSPIRSITRLTEHLELSPTEAEER